MRLSRYDLGACNGVSRGFSLPFIRLDLTPSGFSLCPDLALKARWKLKLAALHEHALERVFQPIRTLLVSLFLASSVLYGFIPHGEPRHPR
jgi:hypothetical protein